MADAGWALIVHGGAREIPDTDRDDFRHGCAAAAARGRAVLEAGGSAVDAAIAAVRALEDDPTFNAGIGAAERADGRVQRDAAVMDGSTLDVGAAAAVEGFPIRSNSPPRCCARRRCSSSARARNTSRPAAASPRPPPRTVAERKPRHSTPSDASRATARGTSLPPSPRVASRAPASAVSATVRCPAAASSPTTRSVPWC
ncbi:hypothetical protein GCM10025869_07110 [Homoserinibacter gongjuensis]|uniref:Asparaginase n=1 Tax=Homoserinibacter gongjuensis TaxID=1162968 RepID=A0ABQ6JTN0_9MICO|nr:hypothetical protein GCM10025869_07110 [Homoserinibacter gongjuensis]